MKMKITLKREQNTKKRERNTRKCTNRYVGKKVLCFWLSCVHCVQYSELLREKNNKKNHALWDVQWSYLMAPGGCLHYYIMRRKHDKLCLRSSVCVCGCVFMI